MRIIYPWPVIMLPEYSDIMDELTEEALIQEEEKMYGNKAKKFL